MDDAGQILKFFKPTGIPTALLIFAITWLLTKFLRSASQALGNRMTERRLVIQQIATLIRFVLFIVAFGASVPVLFSLTKEMMLALGGTIAVTVGFALKDLAASMIAGITLLVDRPFQVGDRITFDGVYGEVQSIGLRSVRLVTLDDNLVTIPNNKFLSDIVASGNAGELNMLVQMDFYIGADQNLETAKRIVKEAITCCTYAYMAKPWTVRVNSVIHEQYFALRLRAKVYVMDVRFEKLLETDVTERVVEGFRHHGIAAPAMLYRHHPPTSQA